MSDVFTASPGCDLPGSRARRGGAVVRFGRPDLQLLVVQFLGIPPLQYVWERLFGFWHDGQRGVLRMRRRHHDDDNDAGAGGVDNDGGGDGYHAGDGGLRRPPLVVGGQFGLRL